jgi:hypothetical protein
MNRGAYVAGQYGLQIGKFSSITPPTGASGAALGWNTTGAGNLEMVLGAGSVSGGGGFNIYNTISISSSTRGSTIFALDRTGSLNINGSFASAGISGTTANFSGAVSMGALSATSGAFSGIVNTSTLLTVTSAGKTMYMSPSAAGAGSYNNATQAGDAVIGYDSNYLTIGTYISGGGGGAGVNTGAMRMDSSGAVTFTNFAYTPTMALDKVGNLNIAGNLAVTGGITTSTGFFTSGVTVNGGVNTNTITAPSGSLAIASPIIQTPIGGRLGYPFYAFSLSYQGSIGFAGGPATYSFSNWGDQFSNPGSYLDVAPTGYTPPVNGVYLINIFARQDDANTRKANIFVSNAANNANLNGYDTWLCTSSDGTTNRTNGTISVLLQLTAGVKISMGIYVTGDTIIITNAQMNGYLLYSY